MFKLDSAKRYENAPKEMIRFFKKVLYLSLEVCYYCIFIPVFFSMKNSPYLNFSAIFIYTIFTWVNIIALLFAYGFYKKSAELHFHAKVYGFWKKLKKDEIPVDKHL
jgi:Putative transmembrane protein